MNFTHVQYTVCKLSKNRRGNILQCHIMFNTTPKVSLTVTRVSMYHSIDSLYSTNSVNVYVPSDNQQFRYKIARGW